MYNEVMSLENVIEFWIWFDGARGDLTIRQVEERAGCPRGRIGNAYSAKREPTALVCDSIAAGLGQNKRVVFRQAGFLPPTPTIDEQKEEILYYFDQMTPDNQETLLVLARALAEAAGDHRVELDEDASTAPDRALSPA
jgi:hypothetical protein